MLLAGLAACIAVLWDTPALYPLRLLVVFFHELSHRAAAVVTGGRIVEIQLNAQEGGLCVTSGGSRFAVLSAGYLGSLACGAFIVIVASRTRADRGLSSARSCVWPPCCGCGRFLVLGSHSPSQAALSFADAGGGSSWNEYPARGTSYTPVFLDAATVTGGKHMEACRERIEDDENLGMLSDEIAAAEKAGVFEAGLSEPARLLGELPARINSAYDSAAGIYWTAGVDRTAADKARKVILDALVALRKRGQQG
ncbi:MAG: hypothetical protein AMXMBFR4_02060 [Candidatus Hydrogenedentota bacterium]